MQSIRYAVAVVGFQQRVIKRQVQKITQPEHNCSRIVDQLFITNEMVSISIHFFEKLEDVLICRGPHCFAEHRRISVRHTRRLMYAHTHERFDYRIRMANEMNILRSFKHPLRLTQGIDVPGVSGRLVDQQASSEVLLQHAVDVLDRSVCLDQLIDQCLSLINAGLPQLHEGSMKSLAQIGEAERLELRQTS